MRIYGMYRKEDVSGLSGEGLVAEVCEFADGTCAMRWLPTSSPNGKERGVRPTTVVHDSLRNVLALHDHDGRTVLRPHMPIGPDDRAAYAITFNDLE